MSRTIQLHTGNQSLITLATSASFAPTILPAGTVSSSGQVSYTGLSNIPTNIVSSSAQVTAFLPVGTVSSSGQISYAGLSNIPSGIVSSSGQVSYAGLSNIPVGIVSSSAQVTVLLPAGTVSSSTQINTGSFSGSLTGTLIGTASWAATASNLTGGTANYIPLWISATAQSSSAIYQTAGNIGIGNLTPGTDGGVTPRLAVANPSNVDKFVGIGYDNTGDYGFVHSIHRATAWKNLAIQAFGGNVGIGTTTPSTTLDVNGISTLRGNLLFAPAGAHDIGADKTNRPRNVYVSSSILVESSSANGITTMLKDGFLSLTYGSYGSKILANWFPASYAGIDFERGSDALLFAGSSVDITSNVVYDGSAGVRAKAASSAVFSQIASTGWIWYHGGFGASGSAITLSNKMFLDTSGVLGLYNNLEYITDNSYDIGRPTTRRPRNIYVAGNVSASSYTSSLGFLTNGTIGYRHVSGSVTALLRANPTTTAVEFGAETNHVVNMTINNTPTYQFGAGAFIPIFAAYNLGALINPWDKVFANNIFSSGSIVHTGSMQIVSGTLAVQSIFEKVSVTASAAPATLNYNVLDQAILFHSASSTTNWTLNFRGNASTTLNSVMSTGQSLTTTLMVLNTTTAYSASAYQIDGTSITPRWQGGTSGSANSNSLDAHTFTIIKTSATPTYVLLGSITKYT
jgi:hypothetical protein